MYFVESTDPLSEVEDYERYGDAVKRVKEIADELEGDGFTVDRSLASRRNMYAIHAWMPGRRGITVEVNDEE